MRIWYCFTPLNTFALHPWPPVSSPKGRDCSHLCVAPLAPCVAERELPDAYEAVLAPADNARALGREACLGWRLELGYARVDLQNMRGVRGAVGSGWELGVGRGV